MSMRKVAADIAKELREHPENWTRFNADYDGDGPRCLMGLIRRRTRVCQTECQEFIDAIGPEGFKDWTSLNPQNPMSQSTCVMLWNDQQKDVRAIIAVCDRVAGPLTSSTIRPDYEIIADIKRKISTELISEDA